MRAVWAGGMSAPRSIDRPKPPRLALTVNEACEALGVGHDFWKQHIEVDVRIVRRGSRKMIAVAELERWLSDNAERVP